MGKSYQRGWVVSRGKKWYGYFRKTVFDPITNQQKSDVVSVVLGLKSQMKASEAREVLEREITKQTGQSGPNAGRVMNDSSVTFGWVCSEPLFPSQRGALEGRNSKGEETPHPKGSHRSVRQDSSGEFGQVHPASAP